MTVKALKVIGIIVLALIVLGGIGVGAYMFGKSQTDTTVVNNNTGDDSNNSDSNNVQPKKVTDVTCNADELSLTLGQGDGGAAGSNSLGLIFTNTGSRECSLSGYPGVSLVNANGNQVGSPAARTEGSTATTVKLAAGATATALVVYPVEGNFDPGTCQDGATKLRVYPPNDYGYLSIASPITGWCPGFQVGPVTAQ
jgi:hypothetical protein